MKKLLAVAPKYLFFTGKGGVGKTSLASSVAVALADAGTRVLLVSTDPASNLDEVLGTELSHVPHPVNGVPGLMAMNIDPQQAALEYRERIVGPYRGILPDAAVTSIEEQLSGACTVEIASFNEFAKLVGAPETVEQFDHVVLDTAPTGHTLRLLRLPAAWNDFIAENRTGNSCLGPLAGLKDQRTMYQRAVDSLSNPEKTLLVLVSRADASALREAARAGADLRELGMSSQFLVINGVFHATDRNDPVACAVERRAQEALAAMPENLRALPDLEIPFMPVGTVGLAALRALAGKADEAKLMVSPSLESAELRLPGLDHLAEELARTPVGVIMTMGKGGVGKTSVAAAVAMDLARRGLPVTLSTTDPAAHVADAVNGNFPSLRVTRIDPVLETKQHVERVLMSSAAGLDAAGLELLEEELRSPCTEEVAVFNAFARTVAEGRNGIVVLDTAPTGHTLLLLDATESYHREVLRSSSEMPEAVKELLPRLRDGAYTRILLVTLPEATPVHEAKDLEADLKRAGIAPYAWVINQSFAADSLTDPLLQARAANEVRYIREVLEEDKTGRVILLPWQETRQTAGARA